MGTRNLQLVVADMSELDPLVRLYEEVIEAVRCLYRRELPPVRLTMPQLKVLLILRRRGSITVGELAEALGVSPPTVTDLVDRMVHLGLLIRQREQHDRRVVRISPTPAGEQAVEDLLQERTALFARVFANMTAEERDVLGKGLQVLLAAVRRAGENSTGENPT